MFLLLVLGCEEEVAGKGESESEGRRRKEERKKKEKEMTKKVFHLKNFFYNLYSKLQ